MKKFLIALCVFAHFSSIALAGIEIGFPFDFYKGPNPSKVISALNNYAREAEIGRFNNQNIMPLVYAFARAGQMFPELVGKYKEMAGKFSSGGFSLVVVSIGKIGSAESRKALSELKKQFPGKVKEIDKSIRQQMARAPDISRDISSQDVDLLWIEFFLTGRKKIVEDIIGIWFSTDVAAKRIKEHYTYYRGHPDKRLAQLLEKLGIEVNEKGDVISDEDIDLTLVNMLRQRPATGQMQERQLYVRKLFYGLGIKDKSKEYRRLLAKANARWTLEANARRSADVLKICENFFYKIEGRKHKVEFLRMLARVYAGMPRDRNTRKKFLLVLQRLKSYTPDDGYIYYMTAQDCISRLDMDCLRVQLIPLQRVDKQSYAQIKPLAEWLKDALSRDYLNDVYPPADINAADVININKNRNKYRVDAIVLNNKIPAKAFGALELMLSMQVLPQDMAEIQGKIFDDNQYLFISCRKKSGRLFEVMDGRQTPISETSKEYATLNEIIGAFQLSGPIDALSQAADIKAYDGKDKTILRFRDEDGDIITLWINPRNLYITRFIVHNGADKTLRAVAEYWQ